MKKFLIALSIFAALTITGVVIYKKVQKKKAGTGTGDGNINTGNGSNTRNQTNTGGGGNTGSMSQIGGGHNSNPISYSNVSYPMAWGMQGDDVKIVQKDVGLTGANIDGYFGMNTESAVYAKYGTYTISQSLFNQMNSVEGTANKWMVLGAANDLTIRKTASDSGDVLRNVKSGDVVGNAGSNAYNNAGDGDYLIVTDPYTTSNGYVKKSETKTILQGDINAVAKRSTDLMKAERGQ